jgi:hypothetical protein
MTDDQVFAVIASPLLLIVGVCLVIFREPFSAAARRQRQARGQHRAAATQTPALAALVGTIFVLIGVLMPILVFTGATD